MEENSVGKREEGKAERKRRQEEREMGSETRGDKREGR